MSPDVQLAESANAFAQHHDRWEDVARVYAAFSEPLFVAGIVLLALAGVVLRRRRLITVSMLAVAASGLAVGAAALIAGIVARPRPFVADSHVHLFLAHSADPGFPSDHATAAFAIAAVLLVHLGRRAIPVLVAAAALAIARVLVGVHYPADVLAGALLGSAMAALVCLIAAKAARWPRLAALSL
jgi:undecaprenyl-diphosphatase